MLTDEDLLRELEAGFREETVGLRYAGRVPTPRRSGVVPWTAVPVAAAAAAVLVLPQLSDTDPPATSPGPSGPAAHAAPESPAGSAAPDRQPARRTVTDTIELAGFAFRYEHLEGTPVPEVYLALGARPPADATPVEELDTAAAAWVGEAWIGTDPVSGDAALWVHSDRQGIGADVMFWSPDLTTDDLARMLRTGSTAAELD